MRHAPRRVDWTGGHHSAVINLLNDGENKGNVENAFSRFEGQTTSPKPRTEKTRVKTSLARGDYGEPATGMLEVSCVYQAHVVNFL